MALTPTHFLTLNPKAGLPVYAQDDVGDTDYSPETTSSERFVALWKKRLKYLSTFSKICSEDYKLSLLERSHKTLREPFSANVGDVIHPK